MSLRPMPLTIVICVLTLNNTQSFAQSVERNQANPTPPGQDRALTPNGNSLGAVANEIELLRKALQTTNLRLREVSDKLPSLDARQTGSSDRQNRVASGLELLARAEERSGILRKQLIELIEKETSYKSRQAQMDEEVRPENVERTLSGVGTTRTVELREVRRRSLEIEKRGIESLLALIGQSRSRLEEDVRQADSLVSRIRQRLLPLIDREVEKLNPN